MTASRQPQFEELADLVASLDDEHFPWLLHFVAQRLTAGLKLGESRSPRVDFDQSGPHQEEASAAYPIEIDQSEGSRNPDDKLLSDALAAEPRNPFVASCRDFFTRTGYLTQKQVDALVKVADKKPWVPR